MPYDMGTMAAYARGQAAKGNRSKVFDWDRAARLIVERKAQRAEAGLEEDWSYTGDVIWKDNQIVPEDDISVYLSSNWATPILIIDGEEIECWLWRDETQWDAKTYWPESAQNIVYLEGKARPQPKLLENDGEQAE